MKKYFHLTKPGILFGNAITATAGFLLASKGHVDFPLFFLTLVGLTLIIASACVFNNYIDRHSDEKMIRTKNRALVQGLIPLQMAILFALCLGLSGTAILYATNLLTLILALAGFFIYLVLYTYGKYRSTHATLVGSIAGGLPPVIGYTAVTHHVDKGAFLLFLMVALWQMPHFFSIALYRLDDYTAASIPVLPVKRGIYSTKRQMFFYIVAFTTSTFMLTSWGYTGYITLTIAALLSVAWLYLALRGFRATDDKLWARKMFRFSLIVITALSLSISFDTSTQPPTYFAHANGR